MNKLIAEAIIGGLMLLALPIALAAQQPAKPAPTPAKPPAASTAAFPKGTYDVTMQDGSMIEVTFADGTYSATSNGQTVAIGKYTAKGNQIVMSDNSDACNSSGEGT